MIFQWKNKAIWLALTGSAVCLGFLGCSKPGGSGTSGSDVNQVKITVNRISAIITNDKAAPTTFSLVYQATSADSVDSQLSVDPNSFPVGFKLLGSNFCKIEDVNSGSCRIPMQFDPSLSGPTDSTKILKINASVDKSGATIDPAIIPYSVVAKTTLIPAIIAPQSSPIQAFVGGTVDVTVQLKEAGSAGTIKNLNSLSVQPIDGWSIKDSSDCKGKIFNSNTDSCNIILNFSPQNLGSLTTKNVTFGYLYDTTENKGVVGTLSIPYRINTSADVVAVPGKTNTLVVAQGDTTNNVMMFSFVIDALGSLDKLDTKTIPTGLSVGSQPVCLTTVLQKKERCSFVLVVDTSSALTGSWKLPLSFTPSNKNKKVIIGDSYINYNVVTKPTFAVEADPDNFNSMNISDSKPHSVTLRIFPTSSIVDDQKVDVDLGQSQKIPPGWDLANAVRSSECYDLKNNQICKITLPNAFNPSKAQPLSGNFTIPLVISTLNNGLISQKLTIPYSVSSAKYSLVVSVINRGLPTQNGQYFSIYVTNSNNGDQLSFFENDWSVSKKFFLSNGEKYSISGSGMTSDGKSIACTSSNGIGEISDKDAAVELTCDVAP